MRLGIDFGTTRTVVAAVERSARRAAAANHWEGGRYPLAVFETGRGFSSYFPGLAAVAADGLEFGWQASERFSGGRTPVLRSIKRVVGGLSPDEIVSELGSTSALELVTDYLAELRRQLLERSNLRVCGGRPAGGPDEPIEAMVAVPATASARQRYLTLEAFSRAGFRVLGMLNEPTAAAIEFAQRSAGALSSRSPKRYVVVYDLGGGTFDTSVVSLEGRRFELLASEGIAELGGDDFDRAILELALDAAEREPASLRQQEVARALEVCREAKESLGSVSRRLLVDLGSAVPALETVTLDVKAIGARVEPLIRRTLEVLDRLFASLPRLGIDPTNPRELGAVYLVGGGSALPLVGRLLRERHGRKVQLAPEPHAATAVGLAIAADPDAAVYVREAVTRYFGVWREGEGGRDKIFDPIFVKGALSASGDHVVERRYSPVHAVGHLRFLECTELYGRGEPAGDVTPWCDLLFPYVPELVDRPDLQALAGTRRVPEGSEHVVERYAYERDGRVRVAIENVTRGFRREFVLGAPTAR